MRRPKLSPDIARLSGRYPAGVLENPKPIAQRFAHSADLREASWRAGEPPLDVSQLGKRPLRSERRSPVRTRRLIMSLIVAALLPSIILGALWLGSTGKTQPPPAAQAPEPQTLARSAVLTASAKIEADAGETVRFAIALDGTDGVPSRSVIAIKGLPQQINFSEGRPFGDSEWVLKPDQIGDLHLVLPPEATGEFKLSIVLIAPDDQVIAEAETLLTIAPQTPPPEPAVSVAGSIASPGEAATAVLPDGSEATVVAVAPDPEISEDAEPTEAVIATSGDTQVDKGEEKVTTPASRAQPNTLGQAETGEAGWVWLSRLFSSIYETALPRRRPYSA